MRRKVDKVDINVVQPTRSHVGSGLGDWRTSGRGEGRHGIERVPRTNKGCHGQRTISLASSMWAL